MEVVEDYSEDFGFCDTVVSKIIMNSWLAGKERMFCGNCGEEMGK